MDSIDSGVGRLVDADMNEESTRLKALQTPAAAGHPVTLDCQLELGNILSLFR